LFGWYCPLCASIFVWIVNIVHLPLTVLGWIQRFFLETFALPIDGWMLLVGNGCYLFFGNDCLLPNSSLYWILDIPWFTKDITRTAKSANPFASITKQATSLPKVDSFSQFWSVRDERRRSLHETIPVLRELRALFALASDSVFAF